MIPGQPLAHLPTHEVTHMAPHPGNRDLWRNDAAMREGVAREGGGWAAALYREAPVNSIWEGSGNIICSDVPRAMFRVTAAVPALLAELDAARGADAALDAAVDALKDELTRPEDLEPRARGITKMMALALQAALLVRHAPAALSDAFCASRLGSRWTGAYGALPTAVDFDAIIDRVLPAS